MKLKWTIHELIKKATNENSIEEKLDLRSFLREEFEDLVDILETNVVGYYRYYQNDQMFVFHLHIKTTLIMLCSITLEKIPVELDFNSQLNFSVNYIDDDTHLIEGITLDLKPYVFAEILVEKPMRVISEGAYKKYHEEKLKLTEKELEENNPFAKLKK
jgi:uncharacterized metal-binding protein YceD (DUF177 family)